MKPAVAKIIPKLLNFEQKQRRMDIAQNMWTTINDAPDLLKKVITGGESWVYGYNIEAVRKMILVNRFGWHIVRLMPINFYGCCRHETCGSEDFFKIAKF